MNINDGLSTSICNYNLKEVLEATIKLIKDPDCDDIVLYPDSPTGAYIIDEGQFDEICKTGRGKFKMRGVITIDEENNALNILSTPLQTYWSTVKTSVIQLLNDAKLLKIIEDKSDLNYMHYKLYLKKEVDPVAAMHMIYSQTQMEKTMAVNFKLIEDYADNDYTLKSILLTWLDFRRDVKRRIYNRKFVKLKEREHILEILLFVLNKENGEKTLKIIKKSENKKEIISKLMSEYKITSLQAEIIAEMKLSAFSKESYKGYLDEKETIEKELKKLNKIIRSPKTIDKIIIEELEEGIKLFGSERKSKIITVDNEVKIRDTEHVLVFTNNGYVKKLPKDIDHIGFINPGDYPIDSIICNNTSDIFIFDKNAKISKIPVSSIQGCALTSEGELLSKYCMVSGGISAVKIKPIKENIDALEKASNNKAYYIMVTSNGIVKKTPINAYTNIKNELSALILKDKDSLVCVKALIGDQDIVLYTNTGYGIRINTSVIKETSRMSIGLKCIDLDNDEYVLGCEVINEKDKELFILTKKGWGKRCELKSFKTMERNSKPLRIISLDKDDSISHVCPIRGNELFNVYMKTGIQALNMIDVPVLPRLSKGKKLVSVKRGDIIINISK